MERRSRSSDYEYLCDIFTTDRLYERFDFIERAARQFIHDRDVEEYVSVSLASIGNAVIDYFADIARLKDFHNVDRINPNRVAAYCAYWIYKREPLVLCKEPDDELLESKPYLADINEWFCTTLFLVMTYDMKKPLVGDGISVTKWKDIVNLINYYFVYRVVTQQSLELMLVALDTTSMYAKVSVEDDSDSSR